MAHREETAAPARLGASHFHVCDADGADRVRVCCPMCAVSGFGRDDDAMSRVS